MIKHNKYNVEMKQYSGGKCKKKKKKKKINLGLGQV